MPLRDAGSRADLANFVPAGDIEPSWPYEIWRVMTVGQNPMDDDRRAPGDDGQQHAAQVWAMPIADLDVP
jgi:hypothetical protein